MDVGAVMYERWLYLDATTLSALDPKIRDRQRRFIPHPPPESLSLGDRGGRGSEARREIVDIVRSLPPSLFPFPAKRQKGDGRCVIDGCGCSLPPSLSWSSLPPLTLCGEETATSGMY